MTNFCALLCMRRYIETIDVLELFEQMRLECNLPGGAERFGAAVLHAFSGIVQVSAYPPVHLSHVETCVPSAGTCLRTMLAVLVLQL